MRVKDITLADVQPSFKTKKEAIDFYERNKQLIINNKKTTKPEFLQSLIRLKQTENDQLNQLRQQRQIAAIPQNIIQAPGQQRANTLRKMETAVNKAANNPRLYHPKIAYTTLNHPWGDYVRARTATNESEMMAIIQRYLDSNNFKVLYSRAEEAQYLNKLKSSLKALDRDMPRGKISYLSLLPNFQVYFKELYNDDVVGLHYRINGFYYDFGTFLMNKYASEATLQFIDGVAANCVLCCIYDQLFLMPSLVASRVGLTKKKIKLLWAAQPVIKTDGIFDGLSFAEIEALVDEKNLDILIKIYDPEINLWREYGKCKKSHQIREVNIVVKNGHAYNLLPGAAMKAKQIKSKPTEIEIHPVVHTFTSRTKVETFYYSHSPDATQCILKVNNTDLNYEFNGVYYDTDYNPCNFKELIEYWLCRQVIPCIIDNGTGSIISVNIEILSKTIVDESGAFIKNKVQFRNKQFKHQYVEYLALNDSLTLGQVAMYLFKTTLTTPLYKITAPTISKIFKEKCSPYVHMDVCSYLNTNVYVFDINRAYRSHCKKIGMFNKTPEIQYINDKLPPYNNGLFMCNDKWYTNEELDYYKIRPIYAIYYDYVTDIIDEFANKLYSAPNYEEELTCDTLPIPIYDEDKKRIFNLLIGKFQPRPEDARLTMVLYNDADLSTFILNGKDKQFFSIEEFGSSYLVTYIYKNLEYSSTNLPHVSAQIISRVKLEVMKKRDRIKEIYPKANIIGTMTDSIIVQSNVKLNNKRIGFEIGSSPGTWSKQYGNNIISAGPGRYRIWSSDRGVFTEDIKVCMIGEADEQKRLDFEYIKKLYDEAIVIKKDDIGRVFTFKANDQEHILMIGEAGVGKSRYINQNYIGESYIRLAPTGVASYGIKASTISSFFKLGRINDRPALQCWKMMKDENRERIRFADTIVIDEYSMVSAEMMEKINEILKLCCATDKAFGNKRLILVGDPKQLQVICGEPFQDSVLYKKLSWRKNKRLDDNTMSNEITYDIKNNPRLSSDYRDRLAFLRSDDAYNGTLLLAWCTEFVVDCNQTEHKDALTVYYDNDSVDKRNHDMLNVFPGELCVIEPKKHEVIDEKNKYIPDYEQFTFNTSYKPGQPIMLTVNKPGQGAYIYNGLCCKLLKCDNDSDIEILVTTNKGAIVAKRLYNYPHWKPAFAITIHKVQSLTCPAINVYIKKNQMKSPDIVRLLYVALSRVSDIGCVHFELTD